MIGATNRTKRFLLSSMFFFGCFFIMVPQAAFSQEKTPKNISPTDVWNLSNSIIHSLKTTYNLTSKYDKEPIVDPSLKPSEGGVKPRNVYQKVCFVAEEYNRVFSNSLDAKKVAEAHKKDAAEITPSHVFGVLLFMKDHLVKEKNFKEAPLQEDKTPGHVYQNMRSISFYLNEIYLKKSKKKLYSPGKVYELNVTQVLPLLKALSKENGVKPEVFRFPTIMVEGIKPRHIFKLQQFTYKDISKHFEKNKEKDPWTKSTYKPIVLSEKIMGKELEKINPGDVFDLTVLIIGELKIIKGSHSLDSDTLEKYEKWKKIKEKETVKPGDVYMIVQHNKRLAKSITDAAKLK